MKFREWLARLLGVHGNQKQQRQHRDYARGQLLSAIEELRKDLRERHH